MNELELPKQFAGSWEHALILTYGADIPFFENALLRQFYARCRNKIILADGPRYLESGSTTPTDTRKSLILYQANETRNWEVYLTTTKGGSNNLSKNPARL